MSDLQEPLEPGWPAKGNRTFLIVLAAIALCAIAALAALAFFAGLMASNVLLAGFPLAALAAFIAACATSRSTGKGFVPSVALCLGLSALSAWALGTRLFQRDPDLRFISADTGAVVQERVTPAQVAFSAWSGDTLRSIQRFDAAKSLSGEATAGTGKSQTLFRVTAIPLEGQPQAYRPSQLQKAAEAAIAAVQPKSAASKP